MDEVIKVDFKVERYANIKIEVSDYVALMPFARLYKEGVGKKSCTLNIVHTTAGYVDICTHKNVALAVWMADNFIIKGVVADERSNHYAIIEFHDKTFKVSLENLLPNKIAETLYSKGIAINTVMSKVLSMHLQWLLGKFEVQDDKDILGWCFKDNKLAWNGSSAYPSMLKYKLSYETEEEYVQRLNMFIQSSVPMQFVICVAIASMLLAYLNLTEKLPVASFGVSLIGTSSTGKTTALQLASSLFSSPDDEAVFSGFYGTQSALTYMLGRHNGVALCYDESTIKNNINKGSFVYTFVEGKDKLRLNPDSTLKERNSWLCTALFSAEIPLIDISENSNLGLGVRMMNMEGYAYTINSNHADEIKTFASKNYGILCNMAAEYLIKSDSAKIKEDFEDIKKEISLDLRLKNVLLLTDWYSIMLLYCILRRYLKKKQEYVLILRVYWECALTTIIKFPNMQIKARI